MRFRAVAAEPKISTSTFKRSISVLQLVMLGVGGIVGTGVFVLAGPAAALHAGPSIVVSFALAGLTASLAAMCYAEAASRVPLVGGAYAYVHASTGRLAGWIIGWDLMLEYWVGNALVAAGWSAYTVGFLRRIFGPEFGGRWCQAPVAWDPHTHQWTLTGGFVNGPALLVLLIVTQQLRSGLRNTMRMNTLLVLFKVGVLLTFVVCLGPRVQSSNLVPFVPPNTGNFGHFGISGLVQAAGLLFFSYVGFDALVTTGQEMYNPRRNLPLTIFLTLGLCTVIYVMTAAVLVGTVPLQELNVNNPLSVAAQHSGLPWLGWLVDLAAIAGLLSSVAMGAMAQPRIVLAMAQNGLLPARLARLNPQRTAPTLATTVCGSLCAAVAGFAPVGLLNEWVSVGTLFNFAAVSATIPLLRCSHATIKTAYSVPGGPYLIPVASMVVCFGLIVAGGVTGMSRILGWLVVGLLLYWLNPQNRKAHLQHTIKLTSSPP